LDRQRVGYAHTRHVNAFTALEVAAAEHLSPHKIAKTVVYAGAQGYGLAILPGDMLINMEILRSLLNDPTLRLATEHELKQLFPECEVGAMPPLGNLFHLPVIVDGSLAEQQFIAFNAGTHRDVIHLGYADYKRLVNPAVGNFAMTAAEQMVF
jgi:Ala-tRNA(Pro) deacylase